MIENTSLPEEMEAFPIPEGAVILDSSEGMTLRELAIAALQKIINDRELTLPLGPELDLNNPKRLLVLNRFAVQVVTAGITTDEIYNLIRKKEESVHELNFVEIPDKWKNENLDKKWTELYKIKQVANVAIEEKRSNKIIGSSLEAELTITAGNDKYELLKDLNLAEYFITSKADKSESKIKDELIIKVTKSKGVKCPRCWKIFEDKCKRCEEVLKEIK